MGTFCCTSHQENFSDEIINSTSIDEIKNYLSEKIEDSTVEQNDLITYLDDNNFKPSTINIEGFSEEDLKKRIPYLDELKEVLRKVIILLEKYPDTDLMEVKRRICDFYEMYTWLYDDEKRYETWFFSFNNFIQKEFEKISKISNSRKSVPVKKHIKSNSSTQNLSKDV